MTNGQGTVKWMAPEILSNAPYTTSADIYSFSLVIWEVITQQPFYEEFKFNSQIEIHVVNHNLRPDVSAFTPAARSVLEKTWAPQPGMRPTASSLLTILSKLSPSDLQMSQE